MKRRLARGEGLGKLCAKSARFGEGDPKRSSLRTPGHTAVAKNLCPNTSALRSDLEAGPCLQCGFGRGRRLSGVRALLAEFGQHHMAASPPMSSGSTTARPDPNPGTPGRLPTTGDHRADPPDACAFAGDCNGAEKAALGHATRSDPLHPPLRFNRKGRAICAESHGHLSDRQPRPWTPSLQFSPTSHQPSNTSRLPSLTGLTHAPSSCRSWGPASVANLAPLPFPSPPWAAKSRAPIATLGAWSASLS